MRKSRQNWSGSSAGFWKKTAMYVISPPLICGPTSNELNGTAALAESRRQHLLQACDVLPIAQQDWPPSDS